MRFLYEYRPEGDSRNFCPDCGEEIRWTRLESGMWIAVNAMPVYYLPGGGKRWLVASLKWDTVILKDCKIWDKGMPAAGLKRGYSPHVFVCPCSRLKENNKEGRVQCQTES